MTTGLDAANHADNQRRLEALEKAVAENTQITEKLVESTAGLLEMWGDAGVFFKWMRRFGYAAAWCTKVVIGMGALWGIGHYCGGPK